MKSARSARRVTPVAADITTPQGREAALAACPAPDILVNNADGRLPGDFRTWTRDDWISALDTMMLCHIEMMRLTVDGMMARGFGRIVNIVSRSVKIPQLELGPVERRALRPGRLRGGARAPDRQAQRHDQQSAARAVRHRRAARACARHGGREELVRADSGSARVAQNPAGRFGQADELGAYCAFLCSAQAGFITAQNLLIDGGSYPGTY